MSSVPNSSLNDWVGMPGFYQQVAKVDTANAEKWKQMEATREQFQKGEAAYSPGAKDYSESMRSTLQTYVAKKFERGETATLYPDFIQAHPTAFKANGACSLPAKDSVAIASNTNPQMLTGSNVVSMGKGLFTQDTLMQEAAQQVRFDRQKQRLGTTTDGYTSGSASTKK